jgi:hypothetical protein
MNLEVWKNIEDHIRWLNDRNVGVHLFQGFDGRDRYTHVNWNALSPSEKEFYVRYVCSRLAPFANIAGWNYTWQDGNGGGQESVLMDLLIQYDPWEHLRSYHRLNTAPGDHLNSKFTFAITEAGWCGTSYSSREHHDMVLKNYFGKPVYFTEGNGLWKVCHCATESTIRRAAWAVTTAGGSFVWDWETANCAQHPASDQIFISQADEYVDILNNVMTTDVIFYKMIPHDELLSNAMNTTFCLAEIGKQYLIYDEDGGSFDLRVANGTYAAIWIDAKTNARQQASGGTVTSTGGDVSFTTPNMSTDWVLVLKGGSPTAVDLSENLLPKAFHLAQNYPNPFNPTTVIRYDLSEPVYVKLEIYNLLEEKIRTLVDAIEPAGFGYAYWDGTNDDGENVASGVYLYRIEAGTYVMTRKLILMK